MEQQNNSNNNNGNNNDNPKYGMDRLQKLFQKNYVYDTAKNMEPHAENILKKLTEDCNVEHLHGMDIKKLSFALSYVKHANPICRPCGKNPTQNPEIKFKRCGTCQTVYYCSRECQRNDWKKHKEICKPLNSNEN
jgi:hypothetical protein